MFWRRWIPPLLLMAVLIVCGSVASAGGRSTPSEKIGIHYYQQAELVAVPAPGEEPQAGSAPPARSELAFLTNVRPRAVGVVNSVGIGSLLGVVGLVGVVALGTASAYAPDGMAAKVLGSIQDVPWTFWDWVRSFPPTWFVTEIIRRTFFTVVGLGRFLWNTLVGIGSLVWTIQDRSNRAFFSSLRWAWQYTTADPVTKVRMAIALGSSARSGAAGFWESVKLFFPALWNSIRHTWSHWWLGLKRIFTDPDMTNEDVMQFGEDTGNVASDVLIVADGIGLVVRAAKGLGILSRTARAAEWAELSKVAAARDMNSAEHLLQSIGATRKEFWLLKDEWQKTQSLMKLLENHPDMQRAISFLQEHDQLRWVGEKLTGPGGTVTAPKIAEMVEANDVRRLEQAMKNVYGGVGQTEVGLLLPKEPGFERFVVPFDNPSKKGIDALAKFEGGRLEGIEAKYVSGGPLGINDLSKYLKLGKDGVVTFDRDRMARELLAKMEKLKLSPADIRSARSAIDAADGRVVYRIELTGPAPTKATKSLLALDGQIVNGSPMGSASSPTLTVLLPTRY